MGLADIDATFGSVVNRVENLVRSLTVMKGLPDRIHVEALREALPEVLADLKLVHEVYCGEDSDNE